MSFASEFATFLQHYSWGSYNATFLFPDDNEPIVTLAERIADEALLIFSPSVTTDLCNQFLDAVRSHDDSRKWPAASRWKAATFGHRSYSGPSDYWSSFKYIVECHRRYALNFGKNGMPDFPAVLATTNPALRETIAAGSIFYRARLHDRSLEYRSPTTEELGAPPSDLAKAGRANAAGIRVLYTSDTEETAVSEIRPHIGSMVSVGRCIAIEEMKVFDLTTRRRVRGLDPFAADFDQHEKDARFLATLNDEFARPLALHAPDKEYAPTQIVAELIANERYDGIKYGSAMIKGGVNYVFFHPNFFTVEYVQSLAITTVNYSWEIKNPNPWARLSELIATPEQKPEVP